MSVFCPRVEFRLKCKAIPVTTAYLSPQDRKTGLICPPRHGTIFSTTWEWVQGVWLLLGDQKNPQGSTLRDGTTGQAHLGRFLAWQARSQMSQHFQLFSADRFRASGGRSGMVAHLWGTDGSPHHVGSRVCIDVLAARWQPIKTGTR